MTQKRKPKSSEGTLVIEFNHSGIPDDELKPEEFDAQQLAVLDALSPDRQEQIRRGYPMSVRDTDSGVTLASFNLKNVAPDKHQMESLCKALYEAVRQYYSDPENVKKFEAWDKERDVKGEKK